MKATVSVLAQVFLFFMGIQSSYGQGGPPMVTDDPGTVDKGHWEINIATLLAAQSDQTLLQSPYFDINYGWDERTQLKIETGWNFLRQNQADTQTGAATALIGVKYRVLDEDRAGIAVSTYPQVQFHHFFSSSSPEINSPGNQYIFPIEFLKTLANWDINPEFGYLYGTVVSSELFYGVVFAFEKAKPWEPLFEIHVNSHLDGSGSDTLLNLGFHYSFNSTMNLLVSAGHTVTHVTNSSTELDAYLGLQLEL